MKNEYQINVKLNLDKDRDKEAFDYITGRNTKKFPTVREYVLAAIEALEVAEAFGTDQSILSDADVRKIEKAVFKSLRKFEEMKIRELMAP